MAGAYGLDTEQSDAAASGGGVSGGERVWAWSLDEPVGRGADGGGDCAGRAGRVHRAAEEAGYAGGGATRHPGRQGDREYVFYLFCGGGDGVAVAADAVFCARGGDGFSARAGDEGRVFGVGRERDAAKRLGEGAGSVAMEPGIVRGDEVRVFLLFGIGAGVDARAGGAAGSGDDGYARGDSGGCADAGLDDGSLLRGARFARAGGGMEISGEQFVDDERGGRSAGRRRMSDSGEQGRRVGAFFDIDGTLVPEPSLEKRLFREWRRTGAIGG